MLYNHKYIDSTLINTFMIVKGIEGLSTAEVQRELAHGAKFVIYQYCISIIIMTFRRPSAIYFVRAGENGIRYGWKYALISFFLGWWGIPWGPIYTIGTIFTNLSGGKDVTTEVLQAVVSPQTSSAN